MRLRRRGKHAPNRETRPDAPAEPGRKRRGRAKRVRGQSQEEVWYHSMGPLFDQPVADEAAETPEPTSDAPGEAGSIPPEVPAQTDMMPPWAAAEPATGTMAAPEVVPAAGTGPESGASEGEFTEAPDVTIGAEAPVDGGVPASEPAAEADPEPEKVDADPEPEKVDIVGDPEKVDIVGDPAASAPSPATEPLAAPEPDAGPEPDAVAGSEPSPAVDPPMIIPIRAYYLTRTDDTLRSIAAQFLNSPSRWTELQSLNAAYPGVATAGPDTLLPVGSSIALPGDPLPWGKPDPVYLWTLAEKFLYAAWGREPSPEEVVPFWRGLTGGAHQLETGGMQAPIPGIEPPVPEPVGVVEPPVPEPVPEPVGDVEPPVSEVSVAAEPSEPAPEPVPEVEPVEVEAPAADEWPPVPEPPPAYGVPAPVEPPRYEAVPVPAAAEEWPAPGYEPVESPAPADPFEPAPEPVGVVEPPVSEPVPDVEPVEVEAPAAYEWPPVPEPSPAVGEPPPAEPPRYEAVPPPAAAEEWLVRGYGSVETPAPAEPSEPVGVVEPPVPEAEPELVGVVEPSVSEVPVAADPFEPVPEPVGDVESPVSEPVPDVEPVEVEAPAAHEWPPVPEPSPAAGEPPPAEPPRYEAVPPPAAAEEWLVRGYGSVETPAPAEPSEPVGVVELPAPEAEPELVGVVEPPVPEVPVAAGPFEPAPEPVGVVEPPVSEPVPDVEPVEVEAPAVYEPPVSEPVPDVEPVEVEAPAVYEPPPFPEQPSQPTYEAPAPPVHEPPRPAYEAPAPSPPQPAYEAPAPPEPPRYEPPTTPAPDFAPMPGMPDLGPIEPETLAGPEAEAPPLPAFMPSVTDVSPSAEMPVEQVVASSQRALAGTAIGDAMMLWQLGRLRRRRGARRGDSIPDPLELSLEQTARMDSLRIIEAAMRHLRAVTIAQLRPKPRVVCVRTGTYGFEVLLDQPVEAPEGWQSVSGGYVLELPRGVTVEQLDAVGQGPSLCPALVPVGDTAEGPLLINIQEIGCLAVSGAGGPTASLLSSIVETLGSSPLAGDIRIITIGVNSPSGPGWERIHATRFDSPQLEHLLSTAHSPAHGTPGSFDVLVVGPGNDLLFQRAGQIATTPGSRLMLVGATSSAAARWPWRIHVDEHSRAVVHPIAVNIVATQAMRPELAYLLSEAAEGPQGTSRF